MKKIDLQNLIKDIIEESSKSTKDEFENTELPKMRKWAKTQKTPKIKWDVARNTFPNLTDEQIAEYVKLRKWPYHSSFSLYDLAVYFKNIKNTDTVI